MEPITISVLLSAGFAVCGAANLLRVYARFGTQDPLTKGACQVAIAVCIMAASMAIEAAT